jgi:hypothetical protein
MKGKRILISMLVLGLMLALVTGLSMAQGPEPQGGVTPQAALGTVFTYQGRLTDGGSPANGTYDFQFKLYDAASNGAQVGSTITMEDVTITDGLFTVALDFGSSAFTGDARYLEIGVRPGSSTGAYTTLTPRQALTPTPYALALPGLWTQQNTSSPNLIGGFSGNWVTHGMVGATIAGGGVSAYPNRVTGHYGVVGGGAGNVAGDTATVAGGISNTASGLWASVPGGYQNTAQGSFSFAAGHQAVANHEGTFVWADSSGDDFTSTGPNQFLIRAVSGVGIGTTNPLEKLHVVGRSRFDLGTGRVEISTPGGWPGIIAYSQNGHRREMVFKDDKFQILTSDSSSPSANDNGIIINEDGDVGIGTWSPAAKLDVNGTSRTRILQITGGSDLAEPFEIADAENTEPGMVVAIDPQQPGQLRIADKAYDRTVAGCVSGANGVNPGLTMQQDGTVADEAFPVALSGRVYCWADASHGPIQPGDLLTTSDTPGHVMAVTDYEKAQGATIGKAMSSLTEGRGLILVLVSLQ